MRNILLWLLFLTILLPLSASPFLTDLMPDYRFDISSLADNESEWTVYAGIGYTHLIKTGNAQLDDYQFNSGIFYKNDLFSFNAAWKGSLLDGLITVQGLDEVIAEGERDISSDNFYSGFQFDMATHLFDISLYGLEREAFFNLKIKSPDLYGFYLAIGAERRPLTFFQSDLVKNYSFNGFLISEGYGPHFGWNNAYIHADLSFFRNKLYFEPGTEPDNPLIINLNCESSYGMAAYVKIDTSFMDFEGSFEQSRYKLSMTGRTESTQILYVESETDPDGLITLLSREFDSRLSFFDGRLQIGGFFQSLHIPNENLNRGYIDMDPLSPVGVLYRRKDVVEDFGMFFQQAGGAVGTEWKLGRFGISATVNLSYMSLNTTGTYYYKDGIFNPIPFPHLTNEEIHDERDITDEIEYLLIDPELGFSLSLGRFSFHTAVSQLIPLNLDTEWSSIRDSLGDGSRTGGFRASVRLSFHF